MKGSISGLPVSEIENRIFTIRGVQVMLDRDLAELYQVETKYINRAVKRNPARFQDSFAFRLAAKEISLVQNHQESNIISNSLRFQNGTIKNRESIKQDDDENANGRGKHSKYLPWVFKEEGVAMLSAVLHSEKAVEVSIKIMQAFVLMRKSMSNFNMISDRINKIEWRHSDNDLKFEKVFNALDACPNTPAQGIFFEGQIFDAWVFVSELINRPKQVLIFGINTSMHLCCC